MKRGYSGISASHERIVKRRRMLGGRPATVNRTSLSLANKVNRLIASQEKKWFDTSVTLTGFTNATPGQVFALNRIPEGVDEQQRIGRKIHLMNSSMAFTWSFYNPAATEYLRVCRVMVVYDSQTNGVIPAVTDVLETADALSHNNLNNSKRFRVLYDNFNMRGKGDNFDAQTLASFNGLKCYDKYTRRLDDDCVYAGSATADPNTGGLFVVAIVGGNVPGGVGIELLLNHRLRYTDA